MGFFGKRKRSGPVRPRLQVPTIEGAWIFTLRSVPRHHDGIKRAIESTGDAHVYFSEPLAYIKGQGVSLFRVEATGFRFLENLYAWWRETERREATGFDIRLYVQNTRLVGNIRNRTPAEVEDMITRNAPKSTGAPSTAPHGR